MACDILFNIGSVMVWRQIMYQTITWTNTEDWTLRKKF